MFLGHEKEVKTNSWKVLPQTKSTKTLVNKNEKFLLQDNICPHQGSIIRQGTGDKLSCVCPYHGWSWNESGEPVGNGTVGRNKGSSTCKNTSKLESKDVLNWCGFLFDSSCSVPVEFDISGNYCLTEYRQDEIKSNYVAIMDLFLDIDHIPLVHPNLYNKIDVPDVKDITWKTWPGGSAQFVPGVPKTDKEWHKYLNKELEISALWLALYPNVMFEWQPGAVFVMVNEPVSENKTISHIFKYRDKNYPEKNWYINENVWEQAWEQDRAQAEKLEPGWRNVPLENLDDEKKVFRTFICQTKN